MGITAINSMYLGEEDPAVRKYLQKINNNNISSQKDLGYREGNDLNNPNIGSTKIDKIALALERQYFDTLNATVYSLKNGEKVVKVQVLGSRGDYQIFYSMMQRLIDAQAEPGNCVIEVSSVEENAEQEIYTIFFDHDE